MIVETNRLIIRHPRVEDAEDIFRNYAQDGEVTKYLTWKPHKELKETQRWVQYCVANANTEKSLMLTLYSKGSSEVIGMIDFRLEGFKAHLGYVLAKEYWNQGLMTEAMQPVIQYLYENPNIYRVWAVHDIENEASGKVMLKLGMQFEGVISDSQIYPNISNEPRDVKCYSLDCRLVSFA